MSIRAVPLGLPGRLIRSQASLRLGRLGSAVASPDYVPLESYKLARSFVTLSDLEAPASSNALEDTPTVR
jgi:hypothetical protein